MLPFGDKFPKLFAEYRLKLINKRLGQQDVSSFFEMDADEPSGQQQPPKPPSAAVVKAPSAVLKRAQDTRSSIAPAKKQKTATGQIISASQTTLDAFF